MPVLKSKTTQYTFSLEEMKKLIAKDMNLPVEAIQVYYDIKEVGGDSMGSYPGVKKVTEIRVTVDETKTNK